MTNTIGFIGAGHIASAIISGLLAENPKYVKNIIATCHSPKSAEKIHQKLQINCRTDNQWLCQQADIIILSVKPQQMQALLEEISSYDLDNKLFITLAAGLHIEDYRAYLGDECTIVRAMPNIAASVQASLTGLYSDQEMSDTQQAALEELFQSIGDIAWLDDETQIDGITALSGSGIAYFFRFMQAMASIGERYGFESDQAYDIVALTVLGAASLALDEHNPHPDYQALVKAVAVKGGTTAKAIEHMETQKIDQIIEDAMDAVVKRSLSLREELTQNWI